MLTGTCHCGAAAWTLSVWPERVTACNCSVCRRYGALWAYGNLGQSIQIKGQTTAYRRSDSGDIAFHFCASCGCITHFVGDLRSDTGHQLAAVNLRMSDPTAIKDIRIRHFEGHDTFTQRPDDGRTVRDLWY